MSEGSQLVVPPSFVALYVAPGRTRPSAPLDEILRRYELCEDLAATLAEPAQALQWKLGVTDADVLERMRRGLLDEGAGVTPDEAQWVTCRLAELLDWGMPGPPIDAKADSAGE